LLIPFGLQSPGVGLVSAFSHSPVSPGMNLGVSIGPWGVKTPARALVWLQQRLERKFF